MVGLQNYWERNQRVPSELEGRSRLLPFWTERQIKKLQMNKTSAWRMMAYLHSDRSRVASMPATYENCPFQAHKNLGLARCSRKTTSRLRGSSNLHCQAQRRKPPHVMIDQYLLLEHYEWAAKAAPIIKNASRVETPFSGFRIIKKMLPKIWRYRMSWRSKRSTWHTQRQEIQTEEKVTGVLSLGLVFIQPKGRMAFTVIS